MWANSHIMRSVLFPFSSCISMKGEELRQSVLCTMWLRHSYYSCLRNTCNEEVAFRIGYTALSRLEQNETKAFWIKAQKDLTASFKFQWNPCRVHARHPDRCHCRAHSSFAPSNVSQATGIGGGSEEVSA